MAEREYPANTADTALRLFVRWFGRHYARAVSLRESEHTEYGASGVLSVGRQWTVAFAVADTLTASTDVRFEAARAALEQRLDAAGRPVTLWVPRGAGLPAGEPGLSEIALAVEAAPRTESGRTELRRPVQLYLRRTGTTGSVITVLGGLAASWAQFTNRVPGTFQLNSIDLHRLPNEETERQELAERIVLAAGQPDVDEGVTIATEDAWTLNDLDQGDRSCVLGSPEPESDEQSAVLRRTLRKLLRSASGTLDREADARALIVLGASTYADEEKLSWALRGMDPSLYAGYDLIAIVADGVVKLLLQPGRRSLPWD